MPDSLSRFDRPILRTLRAEIETALAPIASRHGISLKLGNARFNTATFSMKVEGATVGIAGRPDREALDFARFAPMFGLSPTDYGRAVNLEGTTYAIRNVKPNAPKRPIVLESAAGRRVVVSPAYAKFLLGVAA
jgi:hypothetical protein